MEIAGQMALKLKKTAYHDTLFLALKNLGGRATGTMFAACVCWETWTLPLP